MTKYFVLQAYSIEELETRVNTYIMHDLKPLGGVSTYVHSTGTVMFIQAMTD
jgi:hypothetical protein